MAMTGAVASADRSVSRSRLFLGLFLLATLNASIGTAIEAVVARGWLGAAVNLFDLSAILWVALAAGLKILADDSGRSPWRRGDGVCAAVTVTAALLPLPFASAAALTGLSLWAIATSDRGSPLRRAALIFLAMTGALIWGRLMLVVFSGPLLGADAVFVSQLIGVQHAGNVLWSDTNAARVIVSGGCSSMHGMSLALLFWVTVTQYYSVGFGWRSVLACLAALAATVAVNVLRIGAMLTWPAHFQEIHEGWGAPAAMWLTLALVVGICLFGARREILHGR
jgi:exosortase/archaeosortase family protein